MADRLSDENIIQLLDRYTEGSLSPIEEALFFRWYQQVGWEEFCRLWAQSKTFPQEMKHVPEIPAEFKEQLEAAIDDFESRDHQPLYAFKRIWWKTASVAAGFLLLAGGTVYFLVNRNKEKPAIAAVPKTDVQPPSSVRATITLGNGKKVFLDSAGNGTLAVQGNVTVVKTTNGQVVYNADREPADGSAIIYNTLSNPRGSRVVSLTLNDGTTVWLNSESSLTYPTAFVGTARNVTITGEAYFEVTKHAAMPFTVTKGGITITVLGTQFDVNAYDDEGPPTITLVDGAVRLASDNHNLVLRPGQQAQILNTDGGKGNIALVAKPDVEQALAWKNGRFLFNGADLPSILRKLGRWYDLEPEFKDQIADNYTVSVSRDVPVSRLFQFIEISGGVHLHIDGKKIIVTK